MVIFFEPLNCFNCDFVIMTKKKPTMSVLKQVNDGHKIILSLIFKGNYNL